MKEVYRMSYIVFRISYVVYRISLKRKKSKDRLVYSKENSIHEPEYDSLYL
ncbi:MAG: hypothetical protein XD79_0178 [Atribacteria bacterium 34_128]|nr:MAG: hypothetical protein XD79_0178 [Atribacteria bacterium 34_128]